MTAIENAFNKALAEAVGIPEGDLRSDIGDTPLSHAPLMKADGSGPAEEFWTTYVVHLQRVKGDKPAGPLERLTPGSAAPVWTREGVEAPFTPRRLCQVVTLSMRVYDGRYLRTMPTPKSSWEDHPKIINLKDAAPAIQQALVMRPGAIRVVRPASYMPFIGTVEEAPLAGGWESPYSRFRLPLAAFHRKFATTNLVEQNQFPLRLFCEASVGTGAAAEASTVTALKLGEEMKLFRELKIPAALQIPVGRAWLPGQAGPNLEDNLTHAIQGYLDSVGVKEVFMGWIPIDQSEDENMTVYRHSFEDYSSGDPILGLDGEFMSEIPAFASGEFIPHLIS